MLGRNQFVQYDTMASNKIQVLYMATCAAMHVLLTIGEVSCKKFDALQCISVLAFIANNQVHWVDSFISK